MIGFTLNFFWNFLDAAVQGCEIIFTLTFARLICSKVQHHLRTIFAIQLGLYGALEFRHYGLDLVHFLFGQLFKVLFQILCALDTTGIQ